jgi:hypothetical protein
MIIYGLPNLFDQALAKCFGFPPKVGKQSQEMSVVERDSRAMVDSKAVVIDGSRVGELDANRNTTHGLRVVTHEVTPRVQLFVGRPIWAYICMTIPLRPSLRTMTLTRRTLALTRSARHSGRVLGECEGDKGGWTIGVRRAERPEEGGGVRTRFSLGVTFNVQRSTFMHSCIINRSAPALADSSGPMSGRVWLCANVASCSASTRAHIEARVDASKTPSLAMKVQACKFRFVASGGWTPDPFKTAAMYSIQSRRVHIVPSLDPGQKSVILRCERTDGCWTGPWCLSVSVGG